MKKTTLMMMLILLLNTAIAEKMLMITTSSQDEIQSMFVIEENLYHSIPDYTAGEKQIAFYREGEIIHQISLTGPPRTYVSYETIGLADRMTIGESDLMLSFCDNDGLCEPCFTPGCESQEGFLTCEDCSPSGMDGFCNILDDRICDPDCIYYYDSSCQEQYFLDHTCQLLGGIPCEDYCQGTILPALDSDSCCKGACLKEMLGEVPLQTLLEQEQDPIAEGERETEGADEEESSGNYAKLFSVAFLVVLTAATIIFIKNAKKRT